MVGEAGRSGGVPKIKTTAKTRPKPRLLTAEVHPTPSSFLFSAMESLAVTAMFLLSAYET